MEGKEAEGPEGAELNPHFPQNFGMSYQHTWQFTTSKQQCKAFHNATRSSGTNIHPTVWKMIPLLMKEELLVKKISAMPNETNPQTNI